MKILVISDISEGGASVGTGRLVSSLGCVEPSHVVRWIVGAGSNKVGLEVAGNWPKLWPLLVKRSAHKLCSNSNIATRADIYFNEVNVLSLLHMFKPDVICLQNIHVGMSFKLLERISSNIPLVWTMRDMWPITGYCCYSYECNKYLDGCAGECPQAGEWGAVLGSASDEWLRREKFFKSNADRLRFIAPSRWLVSCANNRFKGALKVECIPNGLDTDIFRPVGNRKALREVLGFPPDGFLILAGAQSNDDARKGTKYLSRAVSLLRDIYKKSVYVVTFGKAYRSDDNNIVSLGTVNDERFLNLCYNAADVFVLPSLADNLPNTLIEATASGTPCVVFDIGGCPEVVRDGYTGFVAKAADEVALADAIRSVLEMTDSERLAMQDHCRDVACKEYALHIQAKSYIKVFEELIG